MCGRDNLTVREYDESIKIGRRAIRVDGLHSMVCHDCGADFQTPAQLDESVIAIADAQRSALLITPREIHDLRIRLKLTQDEARRIFGGGANAFSKYERGTSAPTEAAAKLMLVAARSREAFEELCRLAGVTPTPVTRRVVFAATRETISKYEGVIAFLAEVGDLAAKAQFPAAKSKSLTCRSAAPEHGTLETFIQGDSDAPAHRLFSGSATSSERSPLRH